LFSNRDLFSKPSGALKNETYAGIRYFNRMTRVKKGDREGKKLVRGQWVYRDGGKQ
jgi:hypothetical protein